MQTRTHAEKSDTEPNDDQHTLDLFACTTGGAALVPVTARTDGGVVETDDLPEIEVIEFTVKDNPLRGRCVNCGRDGPVDLDGEFVILHRQDCPRDGVDQ